MNGTVKQFKDTLEVMRKVYPFDDAKTKMQTRDILSLDHNHLFDCYTRRRNWCMD